MERVFEKIDKQWEPGLAHTKRLGIFIIVEALALAASLLWAIVSGEFVIFLFAWSIGAGSTCGPSAPASPAGVIPNRTGGPGSIGVPFADRSPKQARGAS